MTIFDKTAKTTELYGEAVVGRRKAVRVYQGATNNLDLVVYDEDNNIYNLSNIDSIKIRFSEAVLFDTLLAETTGIVTSSNTIKFTIPSSVQSVGGVYIASIGLFSIPTTTTGAVTTTTTGAVTTTTTEAPEPKLADVYQIYLYVEPSVWGSKSNTALPPIDEIRLMLRDSSIVENELLGAVQFPLEEICAAAINTIRYWNETLPLAGGILKQTTNFGYSLIWKKGIKAFLLQTHLEWLRKNRLAYQAGGVGIDDLDPAKYQAYLDAYNREFMEFKEMVMTNKANEVLARGWGKIG